MYPKIFANLNVTRVQVAPKRNKAAVPNQKALETVKEMLNNFEGKISLLKILWLTDRRNAGLYQIAVK